MIRYLLSIPLFNSAARRVIKFFKRVFSYLSDRVRVSGICSVKYLGFRYKIFSKSDDAVHSKIYYDNHYVEADELLFFINLAPYLNTFVDVGANIGMFAIMGSLANRRLVSYCFEPHLPNVARMKKNLALNQLEERVTIINSAVGASKGKVNFTIPEGDHIIDTASVNENWARNFYKSKFKYKTVEVDMINLDEYVRANDVKYIDFIKIDVETYEYEVLKGCLNTINKFRPIVMCEVFYFVKTIPEIEAFFKNLGYFFWVIGKDTLLQVDSIRSCPEARNYVFLPFNFEVRSGTNVANYVQLNAAELGKLGQAFQNRNRLSQQ